jgi:DNA-binding transcriptional MerR regulator
MNETGSSIGEVSERTGLSVHTLRFYERQGILVSSIGRDSGGRRVYTDEDVEWLNVCMNLRATGMPIPQIRRYTELVCAGDGTESERLELLREHRSRMLTQLDELHRCLALIEYKVKVYEDIVASR